MSHEKEGQINGKRHIWTYDDSVVIGPLSTIWFGPENNEVSVWDEILKCGMSLIVGAPTKSKITISRPTWDAIVMWTDMGFTDSFPLSDWLQKSLGK